MKKLISDFGYPRYFEELVIYIECKENLRITLTREGLSWNWADEKLQGRYSRSNHCIKTNLKYIKEKILFLALHYGNRGHIPLHRSCHLQTLKMIYGLS